MIPYWAHRPLNPIIISFLDILLVVEVLLLKVFSLNGGGVASYALSKDPERFLRRGTRSSSMRFVQFTYPLLTMTVPHTS